MVESLILDVERSSFLRILLLEVQVEDLIEILFFFLLILIELLNKISDCFGCSLS